MRGTLRQTLRLTVDDLSCSILAICHGKHAQYQRRGMSGQLIACRLFVATDEQEMPGQRGRILGNSAHGQGAESAQFRGAGAGIINQDDIAGFGLDEKQVARLHDLAMAVMAGGPDGFAGGEVLGSQDAIIDRGDHLRQSCRCHRSHPVRGRVHGPTVKSYAHVMFCGIKT
jgi:hypothetical protein